MQLWQCYRSREHPAKPTCTLIAALTIQHVEERGKSRLTKVVPGKTELPDGGNVRENAPPRWQQRRQTGVSDAAVSQVPCSDLHGGGGAGAAVVSEGHMSRVYRPLTERPTWWPGRGRDRLYQRTLRLSIISVVQVACCHLSARTRLPIKFDW